VLSRVPSRKRDLLELVLGYGLVLAGIWTPMPAQRVVMWLALVAIVAFTFLRYESPASLGLALAGVARSFWIVGAACLIAGITVLAAVELGTLHSTFGNLPFSLRVSGYLVWSFIQEFVLQVFVLMWLMRLLPRRSIAVLIAALLFAVAHLPNPVLVPLTLLWGFLACTLFLRYRNLYAIGLAHAILGICVAVTVPNSMHHHMRVGLGYLHYHPQRLQHRVLQRSSAPHTVSTQACVNADAEIRLPARQARP
jgi:membrane protease YdiL (CAAX protease family)